MKPIKYRAWDVVDKEMCLVQSIHFAEDGFAETVRVHLVGKPDSRVHGESCHLLEYTQQDDVDGEEIYEEHLVEITFADGGRVRFAVKDRNIWQQGLWSGATIRIIGNTFEGAELVID